MTRGSLRGVTKRYGRHDALSDATLDVFAAEILGLVGPNGAGKTTMLRILARMLRPTAGSVEASERVRYFAGEHTLPPAVSTRQWLRLWSASGGANGAKRLGTLSRGMRQRIGLEAILADRSAELILLDEPWEGLDPDASRWLSDELRERRASGAAIVVSSHRIHDLADVCDRCVFLVSGRLQSESIAGAELGAAADRAALLFSAFDRLKRP